MSRPFANNSGKSAFGELKKSMQSSDYIANQKRKNTFCGIKSECASIHIASQGDYLSLKKRNHSILNPYDYINNTELYTNLITKLDVTGVDVISSNDGISPVKINSNEEGYLTYIIDPNGSLFGTSVCGITNFENYRVYKEDKEEDKEEFIM